MSLFSSAHRVLLAGSAFGLLLAAAPVSAQSYYDDVSYGPTENVVVEAPQYYRDHRSSSTGAPIVDIALQSDVSFDDLDLRTDWGARTLHTRVASTARSLCARLDARYPVTDENSPDCYRSAYRDAMAQADEAIAQARGY